MSAAEFQKYWKQRQAGLNSKYGAVPVPAVLGDGVRYRSTLENRYHQLLKLLQLAGEVTKVEREIWFEFEINEVLIGKYQLDFRVTYADGHVEHVDTKSNATLTALYKMKKALMLALHGITLIEKFEDDI